MQLARHLRRQHCKSENHYVLPKNKMIYQAAIKTLKERLRSRKPNFSGFKLVPHKSEDKSDFIGRLEHIFQAGFEKEHLFHEVREMFLYGQLATRRPVVHFNGVTSSFWSTELQTIVFGS